MAGVSGRDRWLHPTVFCGMQMLVRAWDACFWRQSPHMLALVRHIADANINGGGVCYHAAAPPVVAESLQLTQMCVLWIGLFRGSHNACWKTRSAPSGAEVCTFLFWMVHCGMPDGCAVGWVRMVYCNQCLTDLSNLLCGTYDIDICSMLYLYVYVIMLCMCHVTVLWNAYLFGPK